MEQEYWFFGVMTVIGIILFRVFSGIIDSILRIDGKFDKKRLLTDKAYLQEVILIKLRGQDTWYPLDVFYLRQRLGVPENIFNEAMRSLMSEEYISVKHGRILIHLLR